MTRLQQDEKWMNRALDLAMKGEGLTRPNPPVGAVLVKNGRVIGEGFHARAGRAHAEIAALKNAGGSVKGSTLYVTLEPCSTTGRTPPCVQAVIDAGIKRVVVANRDPNPEHNGRGVRLLRRAGLSVDEGPCTLRGGELLAPFSKWIRTGIPYVTLKLALTLDGRIADRRGESKWLTGADARQRVQSLRRRVDAVLVGSSTVLADDPSLLPRPRLGRSPFRVVADSRGRTPVRSKLLNDKHAKQTIIATSMDCRSPLKQRWSKKGAQVLTVKQKGGHLSALQLMKKLGEQGLLHVLCEGGGQLAGSLVRDALVDEFHLYYAPSLLGTGGSRPAIDGLSWLLSERPELDIFHVEQIGKDVMIKARQTKKRSA